MDHHLPERPQVEARWDGQTIPDVVLAPRPIGHIDGDDQRIVSRVGAALDEVLSDGRILRRVELEPSVLGGQLASIFP